jgi:hypothetical protein
MFRLAFVEKTRESDDEKKRREKCRERNYHKLNAIKWIYILFAYITERADTSSCSPLNDEEMQACYVHVARKEKKRIFLRRCLMRSNSNLNIYVFSSYFITYPNIQKAVVRSYVFILFSHRYLIIFPLKIKGKKNTCYNPQTKTLYRIRWLRSLLVTSHINM